MKITLFAIPYFNLIFEFKQPISVDIFQIKNECWLKWEEIELEVGLERESIDVTSLIYVFSQHISILWDDFAKAPKSQLNDNGIKLKKKLRKLITVREII